MTNNLQPAPMKDAQRIGFADWLRVVACFLVMLVHASENFYVGGLTSTLANNTNRFWVAFYDGAVARVCVPLFMIVSAFLLVPMKPGQTMTGFYARRFKRILPPFILFMVLYCILPVFMGYFDWNEAWKEFSHLPLNFPSLGGHFWFIYPLISLYLIIPVVSPWLEKASAKDERIIIGLFVLSTFMPWIHLFCSKDIWGECFWNQFHMLWYVSGYLGYLVLAHYIHYHIDWDSARRLKVGIPCLLVGAAFTGWSFWMKGVPGVELPTPELEWGWSYCVPNGVLATFGAFLCFSAIRGKAPRLIVSLSKMSYGMYLMHLLILTPISIWLVNGNPAEPLLPVWIAIPLIALLTFVCSAVTTKLLSLLPGSKYIVGV